MSRTTVIYLSTETNLADTRGNAVALKRPHEINDQMSADTYTEHLRGTLNYLIINIY